MKNIFNIYLLLILCINYADVNAHNKITNTQQKIIIINGSSSAGKTSIVKELQRISESPLLATGIDQLWDIIPPCYVDTGARACEGLCFAYGYDEHNQPIISITVGSFVKSLYSHLIKSIASFGYDVVIDTVLIDQDMLYQHVNDLSDYTVYFIGVMCDLPELEKREKERGDREIGLARWQITRAHAYCNYYDYTVDTTHTSTQECAQHIMMYISNNPAPTGFQRLKRMP